MRKIKISYTFLSWIIRHKIHKKHKRLITKEIQWMMYPYFVILFLSTFYLFSSWNLATFVT